MNTEETRAGRAAEDTSEGAGLGVSGGTSTGTRREGQRGGGVFAWVENHLSFVLLLIISVLPLAETVLRTFFHTGIPYAHGYLEHLVLWICFVGGMITSREEMHLSLSVAVDRIREPAQGWILAFTALLSVAINIALALAALSFALVGFDVDQRVGLFPVSVLALIMPVGFTVMAVRFITRTRRGAARWITGVGGVVLGLLLGISSLFLFAGVLAERLLGLFGAGDEVLFSVLDRIDAVGFPLTEALRPVLEAAAAPLLVVLIASAAVGTPIFVILGGAALLMFIRSGGMLEIMPNEAYTMLTGTVIPAIPLFTLAGFILSESKAGDRLVKVFRSLFGWFPGGLAIMSVLVCAFFTTFTGGSGVTILALGALLLFVLSERGYGKSFSTGLLTASGSIGLLFPPSLPIIMYGVVAQINIKEMFVGGLIPGVLMVLTVALLGVRNAVVNRVEKIPFEPKNVLPTLLESVWEILLPLVVLVSYFSGFTTLVETAALAVVYVLVVQVLVHRDLALRDLPRMFSRSLPVVGGILIILAVAKGLSYYLVDAQIPTMLTQWSQDHIQSKLVFLILLNLGLLVTGCLMDIYSAITVVAPLIIPLGVAYGVHPVHLGIIFLANLELGYLTPPVGINLFLASYRFEQPLSRIYRNIGPFLVARLVAVLLITYVPWFTTALLGVIEF